jgi:hypothetical protein
VAKLANSDRSQISQISTFRIVMLQVLGTAAVAMRTAVISLCIALFGPLLEAQTSVTAVPVPDWVERSNQNAKLLFDVEARFSPEDVTNLGIESADEQVIDLQPRREDRVRAAYRDAISMLKQRLAAERDPHVRQDLETLIHSAEQTVRGSDLHDKYELPYWDIAREVYNGLSDLLDEQVRPERQRKALVRIRRYAGLEPGYTPIARAAEARIRERLNQPGLTDPPRREVEKNLASDNFYINGIEQLFRACAIDGYQPALANLKEQVTKYNDFLRNIVLPRSRIDFRLPWELYAFRVEEEGVDTPPGEIAAKAHVAFKEIQTEMKKLAPEVAKLHGWKLTDYRKVVRELRKDQIGKEDVLPYYQARLHDIEAIIRRERLVTLPHRSVRMRLATEAESAATPAPFMLRPRLIGNTGEAGEFVLTFDVTAGTAESGKIKHVDDWTSKAMSWTLTAHEARPGHELQYDAVLENGVSWARVVLHPSTVSEGWGLYAEDMLRPYMPSDGQLVSLQLQLLRAARAFLEPDLQSGKTTPERAFRLLTEEVAASEALANSEVERLTFRTIGLGPAYLYGFMQYKQLKVDTEKILGAQFDGQKFHDFILSQGLLPLPQLREALVEEFVPAQEKRSSLDGRAADRDAD